jgi:hypothetical protein
MPRFLSNTSLFLLVFVGKPLEMGTQSLVSYFWAKHSWYGFLMRRFLNGRNQLYPCNLAIDYLVLGVREC